MQPSPRNAALFMLRPAAHAFGVMPCSQGCLNAPTSGPGGSTSPGVILHGDIPHAQLRLPHETPSSSLPPQLQQRFKERL